MNNDIKTYEQPLIVRTFSDSENAERFVNSVQNINNYHIKVTTNSFIDYVSSDFSHGGLESVDMSIKYTVILIRRNVND